MTEKSSEIAATAANIPVFTVSEISAALKRTIEEAYGYVRVRGEISGFKRHGSGHLYLTLKDAEAAIDGVCWRGVAGRLGMNPEDGMEVVCTGRLTTYPGRSRYQLVIQRMELAGVGALLKTIEDRRKRLAAEGLFDAARKRALPALPEIIGVVTSPTGAVIRDILHRLADRCPRHVIVWPVAVQGEGSAEQVAQAIAGFNALIPGGDPPRPDLLIVARGGGSLEDLMAFNEEIVVRAAAASRIPLIAAVGHETDTTLIDHAADRRAPTPSAAAEMAVPVRAELLADLARDGQRMSAALLRFAAERRTHIDGLARGLGDPGRLIEDRAQRLDDRAERLGLAVAGLAERRRATLAELGARLPHPRLVVDRARQTVADRAARLGAGRNAILSGIGQRRERAMEIAARAGAALARDLRERRQRVAAAAQMLESLSFRRVLERGFALAQDAKGRAVVSVAGLAVGDPLTLRFADGQVGARVAETAAPAPPRPEKQRKDGRQGSLL